MGSEKHYVRTEEIDWLNVMPWLRLLRSFHMAMRPAKLLLALMMVVILFAGGLVFDLVGGAQVESVDEIRPYATLSPSAFAQWQEKREKKVQQMLYEMVEGLPGFDGDPIALAKSDDRLILARVAVMKRLADDPDRQQRKLDAIDQLRPRGVFVTALRFKKAAASRFLRAMAKGWIGKSDLHSNPDYSPGSMVGALRDLMALPVWMFGRHPVFGVVWILFSYILITVFGGAISRISALQATRDVQMSTIEAIRSSLGFVSQRIVWYALVFAMPLFVVAFLGVLLAIGGAVFFNAPVLDVIGAVLFVIALGIGFALSVILIVEGFSWPLFQPALSVEGTDAFDAVARAFNYVMGRPLRYMFYMFVSLVSGLVSTLFVALVVYVVLRATRGFVGSGVFVEGRIDAIMPPVDWRDMTYAPNDSQTIAGSIVMIWVNLLVAVIAAYMVSYFYTATTWVYLLLRRSSDGTEFDEVFIDVEVQTTVADAPAEPMAVADAAKVVEDGDSASQNSIN